MRRAVRDYRYISVFTDSFATLLCLATSERYEINESRMTEDCSQYLVQLQKDWERQRVKLGVEALRKEASRTNPPHMTNLLTA